MSGVFAKKMPWFSDKVGLVFGKICDGFHSVFGQNWLGFWKNMPPILGNLPPILGKSATDFGNICHRFWGKTGSVFGKNWLGFWEKLAWVLVETSSVFGKD